MAFTALIFVLYYLCQEPQLLWIEILVYMFTQQKAGASCSGLLLVSLYQLPQTGSYFCSHTPPDRRAVEDASFVFFAEGFACVHIGHRPHEDVDGDFTVVCGQIGSAQQLREVCGLQGLKIRKLAVGCVNRPPCRLPGPPCRAALPVPS